MFAHEDQAPIEARTALRAALAIAEIRAMAAHAMHAVDALLGLDDPLHAGYINRSFAQRRRFARERAQRGVTA